MESKILRKNVYGMKKAQLRKYWIGKLFRGEIPAKPSVAPTTAAAAARVLKTRGAMSVVLSNHIPDNVRVLTIDNKRPGENGYPLVSKGDDLDGA